MTNMIIPQFPSIKFILSFALFVFLTLSILSADFFDPTFFHQLYPIGGIKNWFGIMGALLGGTLIELFGSACLLIPWFILKIIYSPHKRIHLFYHSFLMIISISIAHALWNPAFSKELLITTYLLHVGYIGTLGAIWLNDHLSPTMANLSITFILLYCVFKFYRELPIKLIFNGMLQLGIRLPYYFIRQIWEKGATYSKKWFHSILTFSKNFNRPVLPSTNEPEDPAIILSEVNHPEHHLEKPQ